MEAKTRGSMKTPKSGARPNKPPPAPKPKLERGITERFAMSLEFEQIDVMRSIECGLRQTWITVSEQPPVKSATLAVGAGLGGPWVLVTVVGIDGRTMHYRTDVRPMFQALIERAIDGPKRGT